jgi:hypothetical protein
MNINIGPHKNYKRYVHVLIYEYRQYGKITKYGTMLIDIYVPSKLKISIQINIWVEREMLFCKKI